MNSHRSSGLHMAIGFGLLLGATGLAGAQQLEDLTPIEWRLLEAWRTGLDPYPEVTLKTFYDDTWYRGEGLSRAATNREPELKPKLSAEQTTFEQMLSEAERGDAQAQFQIGELYDAGKGVRRDISQAFKWWLESANQGYGPAEHNVGVAYVAGLGVTRNREEAVKWLRRAAEKGDLLAKQYAARLEAGLSASESQSVLPPTQTIESEVDAAAGRPLGSMPTGPRTEKERVLSEIASKYADAHTDAGDDLLTSLDMANDLWNQLLTNNIKAAVMIGNVHTNIDTLLDADHAWVQAEAAPGKMVALDPHEGRIISHDENPRFYRGHLFSTPKELKEYQSLARQYRESATKYEEALDGYNRTVTGLRNANWSWRESYQVEMVRKEAIVAERKEDLNQVTTRLKALLNE